MTTTLITKRKAVIFLFLVVSSLTTSVIFSPSTYATEKDSGITQINESDEVSSKKEFTPEMDEYCGELTAFTGEIEVLDSARTQILSSKVGMEVPCGAWITVLKGWAELRHRDGYEVRGGESTFFSWVDPVLGDRRFVKNERRMTLYKGTLLVKSEKGGPEVRVDTPGAVARVKQGRAIVLFDELTEETQLLGIAGKNSLENRYVTQSAVSVKPGEMTRLNLNEKRIVPTPAASVAIAPLRPLILGFGIIGQEKIEVLAALDSRRKILFPSVPLIKKLKNVALKNAENRDVKKYVQTSPEDFKGLPEFGASGTVNRTLASTKQEKRNYSRESKISGEKTEKTRLMRELRTLRPE